MKSFYLLFTEKRQGDRFPVEDAYLLLVFHFVHHFDGIFHNFVTFFFIPIRTADFGDQNRFVVFLRIHFQPSGQVFFTAFYFMPVRIIGKSQDIGRSVLCEEIIQEGNAQFFFTDSRKMCDNLTVRTYFFYSILSCVQ